MGEQIASAIRGFAMSFLRPKIKGLMGELKTKLTLRYFLSSKDYHFFDNFIIKDESDSTQIDHIIVSKYKIFVVETKEMDGWIFGNEKSANWTQTFYNNKKQFQNPLRQNYKHTMSLSKYLDIAHDKTKSIVIFWGGCKFKTEMPENVIRGGFNGGAKYIERFSEIVFTDEEVLNICNKLKSGKAEMGILSGRQHTQSLKKRFESDTVCPKCGGNLLERSGAKGAFIGCDNYPKCRFTKEIVE